MIPPDTGGIRWRPLELRDVPAWHRSLQAVEAADDPSEHLSADDLRDELESPDVRAGTDTLAGFAADGEVAAFGMSTARTPGTSLRRYDLWGAVHPAYRGRGLGRVLLGWQEARAAQRQREGGPELPGHVGLVAEEGQDDVRRLAERAGFPPSRWYTVLRRPLPPGESPPTPRPPDGVRVVPFTADLDEPVRLAHNEAWLDHWGAYPQSPERWQAWVVGHRNFRRDWSHVALTDAGEVAGYAANSAFHQDWAAQGYTEGFTTLIAVRRPWRGRGVAGCLLASAIARFAADGIQYAGLEVDSQNPTGALQLYVRLGYRPIRRTVMYGKDLPPPGPA